MTVKSGQHFLVNGSAIKKIIASLGLQPDDTVIEIGPGRGALTFPIIKECKKLGSKIIAIEKDARLANGLWQIANSNFKVIVGDALKELPKLINSHMPSAISYKLVGNIPYYITGKLLRIISELPQKPVLTVLMLQKEVAERITAQPPKMNLLAAAVQYWAKPEILFKLKPDDFNPLPKVDSAVISLTPNNKTNDNETTGNYYRLIRVLFKQPRKTVANNLRNGFSLKKEEVEAILAREKIDPNSRPQNLSIKTIELLNYRVMHLVGISE